MLHVVVLYVLDEHIAQWAQRESEKLFDKTITGFAKEEEGLHHQAYIISKFVALGLS